MLNLHIGSNQPSSRSYMTSPLLQNTSPSSSTEKQHKLATRCHSSTPSNKHQVQLSHFSPSGGGDVKRSLLDGNIKQPVPIRSRVSFYNLSLIKKIFSYFKFIVLFYLFKLFFLLGFAMIMICEKLDQLSFIFYF